MLIIPIPQDFYFPNYVKGILFPTTKGWLTNLWMGVSTEKSVFEVTQAGITPKYRDAVINYVAGLNQIYFQKKGTHEGIDEDGNVSPSFTHPKAKETVDIWSFKDFCARSKTFFKAHHDITHDALFIQKDNKTKIITIPETILQTSESRDNNTILAVAKQNFYIIDNPLI